MKKTCLILLAVFLTLLLSGACGEGTEKPRVLVALGDSYTSGEGIEPFYGQDAPMAEKCKNPDWLAHRSEKAWPGLLTLPGVSGTLAEHRGENYFFNASSGAFTYHLYQLTEEEIETGQTASQEKTFNRSGISGAVLLPPQLNIFDELDEKGLKADYVVLTISGNDVDFEGIAMMSMLGQTKKLAGETNVGKGVTIVEKMYEDDNVRDRVKRVLYDIASRAGEQAVILVVGYPYPLIDDTADNAFSKDSAMIMNEANFFFCMALENVVVECREEGLKTCYVGVNNAFKGHAAYTADPYINPVILIAGSQDLKSIGIVNSASLHPNEKGAEAYARCVQDAIDQLEAGSDRYIFDLYGLEADENEEDGP